MPVAGAGCADSAPVGPLASPEPVAWPADPETPPPAFLAAPLPEALTAPGWIDVDGPWALAAAEATPAVPVVSAWPVGSFAWPVAVARPAEGATLALGPVAWAELVAGVGVGAAAGLGDRATPVAAVVLAAVWTLAPGPPTAPVPDADPADPSMLAVTPLASIAAVAAPALALMSEVVLAVASLACAVALEAVALAWTEDAGPPAVPVPELAPADPARLAAGSLA